VTRKHVRNRVKPTKKKDWKQVLMDFFEDPKVARGHIEALKRYGAAVKAGADPIEAAHNHICGQGCWHDQLKKVGIDTKGL
jgi:hypothetical protein